MKKKGREIQVVLDGAVRGLVYLPGVVSFKTMAEAACALRGVRTALRKQGVAGWGFDGANFYITTRSRRVKAFAPDFQWFVTSKPHAMPKLDFGPNPFTELLR